MSDRLKALADAGVSIWLDDLSRERIVSGSLQKLIDSYKDKTNVQFLTLNMDENPGLITPFLAEHHLSMIVLPLPDSPTRATVRSPASTIPVAAACSSRAATFTASPVAFDGKILLTSEDGDTFVIKAGPKHEVIATNSIAEPVYASPAISDGMIFIRGEKNLYCIGN